ALARGPLERRAVHAPRRGGRAVRSGRAAPPRALEAPRRAPDHRPGRGGPRRRRAHGPAHTARAPGPAAAAVAGRVRGPLPAPRAPPRGRRAARLRDAPGPNQPRRRGEQRARRRTAQPRRAPGRQRGAGEDGRALRAPGGQAMRLALRGGRLLDGAGDRGVHGLYVRDGVIEGLDLGGEVDLDVDAAGRVVTPAFLDLHAHLRDPGQEVKEDLASGLAAAAAGGYGTVVSMANTDPVVDDPGIVADLVARA